MKRTRTGARARPWARTMATRRARESFFDEEWADHLCKRLVNSAHPKQRSAVEDDSDYVTFLCARGAGKTSAEILRMLRKMIRIPKARCVYIATTKEAARDLIWDDLKDIVEKLGLGPETGESRFAETRLVLTLARNGSTLKLVGADDEREIDKLRGKSYHEVGIDEAASHPDKLLSRLIERVIGPRLGNTKGCIALFGTPGHVLSGLFYDATRPGSPLHRPWDERHTKPPALWSSHQWGLPDGAPHVPAIAALWERALRDKALKGWSDDHPVWRREYLGLWAADDTENVYKFTEVLGADDARGPGGITWNIWDPERIGPLRIAKLPEQHDDWLFSLGADMGASDPFALVALAASPSDPTRTLYEVYEFESEYDVKMYAKRIAEVLFGPDDGKGWPHHDRPGGLLGAIGWPVGSVADISHLGAAFLEELANVYGYRFAPGPRNPGDKLAAIEHWNGDLVDGRIKLLKGGRVAKQMASLQWIVDEYGKVKENKAQANHAADAALMARAPLAALFVNAEPAKPPTPAIVREMPRMATSDAEVDRRRRGDLRVRALEDDVDSFGGSFDDSFDDGWGNGGF